jgi:glucokinase
VVVTGEPRSTTAVGVDVGGTKTAVALVRPDGHIEQHHVLPTHACDGAEQLHARLRDVVADLRHHAATPDRAQVPVGIALPELVAPDGEVLTDVVVPGLTGALAQRWHDLGVTVVEADVRAAAVAEAELGRGRGLHSFVYVSVGTGISSCLVLAGNPWPGAHGAAILLGSGVLVDTGDTGGQHPLEEQAGGPALLAAYRAAGGTVASTQELVDRAAHEDLAARVVRSAGRALGLGLAEAVNLLDPQAVVVGGGLGCAPGAYWQAAVEAARAATWAEVSHSVPLLQAGTGPDAGVVGAALLAGRG